MPAPPSKPASAIAFTVVTLLNVAMLAGVLLTEAVIAERRWWGTLILYSPQAIFLVPTLLILLAALLKKRRRVLAWNLPALCLALWLLGINIPFHRENGNGVPLRVMTWNVHHLSAGTAPVIAEMARVHADIICLQEAREVSAAAPEFRRAFPGWTLIGGSETVILTRFPVRQVHRYPSGGGRVMLEAQFSVQDQPLTVIDVHYQVSHTPNSLIQPTMSRRAYLQRTAAVRQAQTRQLLAIATEAGSPLLIAGDFNTPSRGLIYRQLASCYRDLFAAAGWGTGNTFPSYLPALPIDHLFTAGLTINRCHTICTTASDHYPLVAEVQIKQNN